MNALGRQVQRARHGSPLNHQFFRWTANFNISLHCLVLDGKPLPWPR